MPRGAAGGPGAGQPRVHHHEIRHRVPMGTQGEGTEHSRTATRPGTLCGTSLPWVFPKLRGPKSPLWRRAREGDGVTSLEKRHDGPPESHRPQPVCSFCPMQVAVGPVSVQGSRVPVPNPGSRPPRVHLCSEGSCLSGVCEGGGQAALAPGYRHRAPRTVWPPWAVLTMTTNRGLQRTGTHPPPPWSQEARPRAMLPLGTPGDGSSCLWGVFGRGDVTMGP